ncbi:MAG TPA: DUF4166 domain-containing protein [Xanthobacteraceae bacterium]|nr:DUF4166 domain-containing protein [Xanthobacteraceae bacterium]
MRTEAVAFELVPELALERETERPSVTGRDIEARPDIRTDPNLDPNLGDPRFRALLRERDWMALPAAIRRRFSKRLPPGGSTVYAGEVLETRMSVAGWLLAQALRLIGGPLPTARCAHLPSVVTVTEDKASGGQIWTRMYARRKGFPQVVHSAKRFAGPSGLEEYVGLGVGMALDLLVRDGALIFRSHDYFLQLFGRRFVLPAWLCPGELTVIHAEVPDGRFSFTLQLVHPRLGLILRQMALYRELGS